MEDGHKVRRTGILAKNICVDKKIKNPQNYGQDLCA